MSFHDRPPTPRTTVFWDPERQSHYWMNPVTGESEWVQVENPMGQPTSFPPLSSLTTPLPSAIRQHPHAHSDIHLQSPSCGNLHHGNSEIHQSTLFSTGNHVPSSKSSYHDASRSPPDTNDGGRWTEALPWAKKPHSFNDITNQYTSESSSISNEPKQDLAQVLAYPSTLTSQDSDYDQTVLKLSEMVQTYSNKQFTDSNSFLALPAAERSLYTLAKPILGCLEYHFRNDIHAFVRHHKTIPASTFKHTHCSGKADESCMPGLIPSNAGIKALNRMRLRKEQMDRLKDLFDVNPHPNPEEIDSISREIRVETKKIKIWFQNQRARVKHKAR
ncbi:hypothetical protein BC830DRAFT_1159802, partial [Chytriomyces sp. MP71]